jgi:predicted dehydrogenase
MPMTDVFSLAIVGAGGIANAHVGAVEASDGQLGIVAVVDPRAEAAETLASRTDAKAVPSAEALFREIDAGLEIDALLVCTPPSTRLDIVRGAFERGIAVMVEKPLAHTLADAERHAALAAEYPGVVAAIGYCHRFTPGILEMQSRMAEGGIGTATRFENTFATYFPGLRDRWMSDPNVSGGGSFLDTGSHSLDLFRFLMGEGDLVGIVKDHQWPGRGESSATALVRARATGVAGVILSGWLEPDRFTVRLVGTEGAMVYDYLRPTELGLIDTKGNTSVVEVESHEVRFARQLRSFASAVRGGDRGDLATFSDGLGAARLVDAARRQA